MAAALIHAGLIREHFREGTIFGSTFVAMAALQIAVAVALLARPGRVSDAMARNSLVVLIALYLLARVVPVPGDTQPEAASVIGAVAIAVETAALVSLARIPRARPPRLGARALGTLAATGSALALLLVTSSLRYSPASLGSEFHGSAPVLLYDDRGLSTTSPQLTLYLTNHLVLFGSLLTLTSMAVLAAEIGIGAARSRGAVLAGSPERRHWFWAPAFFAAPVCCGAPLLGIVGPAAFAALLKWGWAPLLIAISLGGLALAAPNNASIRAKPWHGRA